MNHALGLSTWFLDVLHYGHISVQKEYRVKCVKSSNCRKICVVHCCKTFRQIKYIFLLPAKTKGSTSKLWQRRQQREPEGGTRRINSIKSERRFDVMVTLSQSYFWTKDGQFTLLYMKKLYKKTNELIYLLNDRKMCVHACI